MVVLKEFGDGGAVYGYDCQSTYKERVSKSERTMTTYVKATTKKSVDFVSNRLKCDLIQTVAA